MFDFDFIMDSTAHQTVNVNLTALTVTQVSSTVLLIEGDLTFLPASTGGDEPWPEIDLDFAVRFVAP